MRVSVSVPRAAAYIVLAVSVFAGSETVFKDRNGDAIRGYGAVAYFTEHRPVKGADQFTYSWMDAKWKFASAANRDKFVSDPAHYAPQYGGYCSYGLSRGHKSSIDPEAWRIIDGKLYLNYSKDVKAEWEKDSPGNIRKANVNWKSLGK